ncbi:MAG TPA: recombinase family protein [Vicinamibacterales bacterium]|nr:recombinase family protein [Vicinamibacterales bacterium]
MTKSNAAISDVSRRAFLVASSCGLAGTAFGQPGAATAGQAGRARSTILFFLCGGASHIDTWDMKPDAPAEIRGEFQPIATSAPGVRLGDESEVATVRRMYSLYLSGQSIRSIAHLLTQERVGGAAWSTTTIQSILTSQTYVGTFRWNTARRGKYHSVAGGEVAKQGQRGATTPGDWIVIEDNHPAIIDRQTFDKVQAALAERKRMTTSHKGGGGFMLTGLCRCGKCGGAMVGHAERGSPRYLCLRHERTGACDVSVRPIHPWRVG